MKLPNIKKDELITNTNKFINQYYVDINSLTKGELIDEPRLGLKKWLTVDNVIEIYNQLRITFGGICTVRSPQDLEWIMDVPNRAIKILNIGNSSPLLDQIIETADLFLRYRPLASKNVQVSLLVMLNLLKINDFVIDTEKGDLFSIFKGRLDNIQAMSVSDTLNDYETYEKFRDALLPHIRRVNEGEK